MPPDHLGTVGIPVGAIVGFLSVALWGSIRRGIDDPVTRKNKWTILVIWLLGPATAIALMCCLLLAATLLPVAFAPHG